MPRNTCRYTHDVSDNAIFPNLTQEWRCQQSTVADTDLCIFHLQFDHKAKTSERITTTLKKQVLGDTDTPRRILGAKLPTLDLAYHYPTAQSIRPFDLREAIIDGDITFQQARIEIPIWLQGSQVNGDLNLQDTIIKNDLYLNGADIEGTLDGRRAAIHGRFKLENLSCSGRCILQQATLHHGLNIQNGCIAESTIWHGLTVDGDIQYADGSFHGPVNIERATIHGDVIFDRIECNASLRLRNTEVDEIFSLNDAEIQSTATFAGASLRSDADFRATTFHGKVDFREAIVHNGSFGNAIFNETIRADRAVFSSASFDGVQFGASAVFTDTEFDTVSFHRISISDNIHLPGVTVQDHIQFEQTTTSKPSALIDCRHSTIHSGRFAQLDSQDIYFDFTSATLGDLSFITTSTNSSDSTSQEEQSTALFKQYRFLRTTFDDFDFTKYDTALKNAQWNIHHYDGPTVNGDDEGSVASVGDIEKTYTKAKQGASDVGATRAAGMFFQQELKFRRKGHAERRQQASFPSLQWSKASYQWLANWSLRLSSGYGERLGPVIMSTALIIGLSAGGYAYLLPTAPYDAGWIGYLLFSLVAYVKLVLGGVSNIDGIWVRLLAEIEGLLGAFFIALFVFVLTRSLHR